MAWYLPMTDIDVAALDRELKKGAAELLLLSVLEARPRHGYELGRLIEARSGGRLVFHLDSLYPLLSSAGRKHSRRFRPTTSGRRALATSFVSCSTSTVRALC